MSACPDVIARVIERDLARTSRLVRLRIVLPDYPSALAAVTELIARQENLNFTPGERYLYSNSGYFLLAVAIWTRS